MPLRMNVLEHATFELTIPEGRTVLVDPRLTGNPLRLLQAPRRAGRRRRSVTNGHHAHVGNLFDVAPVRARGSSLAELGNWMLRRGLRPGADDEPQRGAGHRRSEVTMTADHALVQH